MSRLHHGLIVVVLMAAAGALLVWKSSNAALMFADGLRYIGQARQLEDSGVRAGLLDAIDHPMYPLAIAGAHRLEGGDGPLPWERAAHLASALAGVLLVLPLYLVAIELVGGRAAWMACVMAYLSPTVLGVLADVLSEGSFLLFWTWGLWAALQFLRDGRFGWLLPMIAAAGLAYFTRPEGLLLPMAVVATLGLMPLVRSTRLNWPRWWAAVGLLVIVPALMVGPYMAYKGGLGTKPAIARLIGTAPASGADAVERSERVDPDETAVEAAASASKTVFESIRETLTLPVLLLVPVGLYFARREGALNARHRLFLGVLLAASALGLLRLRATGGYCTPRHTLIPALLLFPFAAMGLDRLLGLVRLPTRSPERAADPIRLGPMFWPIALTLVALPSLPALRSPLNGALAPYRQAADWLTKHAKPGESVVDVTGWTLYYGEFPGYTFADLIYSGADQDARWVVAREAHYGGEWEYCRQIRSLVGPLRPVAVLPEDDEPGSARILIFDRRVRDQALLMGTPEGTVTR